MPYLPHDHALRRDIWTVDCRAMVASGLPDHSPRRHCPHCSPAWRLLTTASAQWPGQPLPTRNVMRRRHSCVGTSAVATQARLATGLPQLRPRPGIYSQGPAPGATVSKPWQLTTVLQALHPGIRLRVRAMEARKLRVSYQGPARPRCPRVERRPGLGNRREP